MAADITKSWFAVLNNPQDHGYVGTPEEICNTLRDEWVQDSTTRSGAWAYCVSADGLHHVHMVLEDNVAMRFSAVKKTYAIGTHLEPTKGSKQQAEDYIYKRHPYDEKGEKVVYVVKSGEIKGNQGHRSDLDRIEEMLDDGKKPDEIFAESFGYTRYSKQIRDEYFRRRKSSTPTSREMECHLIIGDSGSGKTHTYIDLCNQYGDQEVCIISDYENGGFDHYAGEKILFMDEYKGQLSYSAFLSITDHYKVQVHARYSNIWALWQQVYITSIYPPEELYNIMVPENRRTTDSIEQLYRRLTDITYCYKKGKEYKQVTIPATQYKDYKSLKRFALYGKK